MGRRRSMDEATAGFHLDSTPPRDWRQRRFLELCSLGIDGALSGGIYQPRVPGEAQPLSVQRGCIPAPLPKSSGLRHLRGLTSPGTASNPADRAAIPRSPFAEYSRSFSQLISEQL